MIFYSACLIHHNRLWTKNVNRGFLKEKLFIFFSCHSTSLETGGKCDVKWRKRAEKYDYRSMLEFVDFSNAPKINITNWMDAIINESKHIFNGKKNGTTFIFPNPFICSYMLRYKRHNKIECILPLYRLLWPNIILAIIWYHNKTRLFAKINIVCIVIRFSFYIIHHSSVAVEGSLGPFVNGTI